MFYVVSLCKPTQSTFDTNDSGVNIYLETLEGIYSEIGNIIDRYGDFYDQYVLYNDILTADSSYADYYKEIINAYSAYRNAANSEEETKAIENFSDIMLNAINEASANDDWGVVQYFKNMYPALYAEVMDWKFDSEFDAHIAVTDSDGNYTTAEAILTNAAEQFSDLSAEEIEAGNLSGNWTDEQIKAYTDLNILMGLYECNLDDLIEKMRSVGLYIPTMLDQEALTKIDAVVGEDASDSAKRYYENADSSTQAIMQTERYINALRRQKVEIEAGTRDTYDYAEAINMVNESLSIDNSASFTEFTDNQSQSIDDFQSKVKTLSDTLSYLQSGSLQSGDLTDLIQEFPELQGKSENLEQAIKDLIYTSLQELYNTLGEGLPDDLKNDLQNIADFAAGITPSLDTAFSAIQQSYAALEAFQDALSNGMSDDALSSVASLSTRLNDLVAGFYAGTVSVEELYEALQEHYHTDSENYNKALIAKNEMSQSFYEVVGMTSTETIDQFKEHYQVDLSYCKTYNAAKQKIYAETAGKIQKINGVGLSAYYNADTGQYTETFRQLKIAANNGVSDAQSIVSLIETQVNSYENAMAGLNEIISEGIGTSFNLTSRSLNDTFSSSTAFSKNLNWIEKLIHKATAALDKLKDKISNTYLAWSVRGHSLSQAMTQTNHLIQTQQAAYEKYMQKAAAVGLSQEYINKIQNGTLDIETITDESLSNMIEEYQSWYDKAAECSDAIEDLKTQLAELAKQNFDNISAYFDSLMQTTQASISKLENQGSDSYKAYNPDLYRALYAETQNLISYNTQKVQKLEEALDSAVHSGYIEAGSEAWREMYNQLLKVNNAAEEYKIELQEIKQKEYEALLQPYENELTRLDARQNIIDKMIDRLELQGYAAGKGLYERRLRDNESGLQTLKQESLQLQQNMQDALTAGLEIGSPQWLEMQTAIDENVVSTMELENRIIELNNALRQLEWEKFDRFHGSISRLTKESDFLIDLFAQEDQYDGDGNLTASGSAVLGLHAQNYYTYQEQAESYQKQIDKINQELAADPTNQNLIDRKNDLVDAYQDAVKGAYDERQALIDLAREGYQAQIDSIQELIDARKELLDTEKSAYEYQKNIAEKTQNVADIQKQLSALSGDDSEENKARIQQLKVDLEEAQKDLEETQYDKWYSDQTDMLDKLAEEYEALMTKQSQEEQAVFREMITHANANAQDIRNTITDTAEKYGYVPAFDTASVWETGANDKTDIGQNIAAIISQLYDTNEKLYQVSANLGDLGVTGYGLETTISDETTARSFIERLYKGLLGRASDKSGMDYWLARLTGGETVQDIIEGFLNSPEYLAMNKSAGDTIHDLYEGVLGRSAEAAGHQYWLEQYQNGMSLSEIAAHGFLDSAEFLFENFWMRLLDDGLLSLSPEVLAASGITLQNLLPLSDSPELYSSAAATAGNYAFGDINITIPIEHVSDYNDFVAQLQKDGKFERMIQDMTIGQVMGKNSLSKNNYNWS